MRHEPRTRRFIRQSQSIRVGASLSPIPKLLNTDQSLCEIALASGFADQSHFTRVFSERIKASPAAWRRAQRR
jgi:transcriptional regulator GlxA family with amidase domain